VRLAADRDAAEDFRRRALAAADQQHGPVRWFVLNVEVDFTALEALDAIRKEITRRGGVFALARVKQDLLARLRSFGLADAIGEERLFPTLPTAVEAYRQWAARNGPETGKDDAGAG
jgi:MFS superfamily sulfate permease-like transporter